MSSSATLEETERAAVARLVHERGTKEAADLLTLAPATIARVVAGLPVARGTVALVRQNLDAALSALAPTGT